MALQTEYDFVLPKGYVDRSGSVHRNGRMRLATAGDEILPLGDRRVQSNAAYLTVIVLSRVVVKLGSIDDVSPDTIESLFAEDFAYLQELYRRINGGEKLVIGTRCAQCDSEVEVSLVPGEFAATPSIASTRR
jgi:hypothetical protein